MAHILIKNVGPIREAALEIKRINVFMGPQSSGKSTIAKIISQALWAEKNFLTLGEEFDFYQGLLNFHNIDENSLKASDLEIRYESEWCIIEMRYQQGKRSPKTFYKSKENSGLYHNAKIEYVPAERNFVSTLPNIQKYNETRDNKLVFSFDWNSCKKNYQRTKHFEVDLENLHFWYRFKESEERDVLRLEDGTEIDLQTGSSGQQSILPLMLVADNVMKRVYETEKVFSYSEIEHIKKKAPELSSIVDIIGGIGKKARNKEVEKQLNALWNKIGYNAGYGSTHLIIEEPEQNLYPSTQGGLVRKLVSYLNTKKPHTLTLTTHSPFILYALDNCMLAGLLDEKKASEIMQEQAFINPKNVGLWLVDKGTISSMQDDNAYLLNRDFFNDEFQKGHELMYELLKAKQR